MEGEVVRPKISPVSLVTNLSIKFSLHIPHQAIILPCNTRYRDEIKLIAKHTVMMSFMTPHGLAILLMLMQVQK
jgi:hypothetical protein